ncbi:uncharacterized protein LOC113160272 isoform X5 [Anabas testudineus]|uniref:uncharacterized protein LOC113160272 isoform X5 n=1 Tax=Anabas testudineus TaxID=64144 RepID=UPI000E45E43E|nr:uncharacterized protein LOC113160272 isoform X5 [Anabas testudineus]
MDLTSSTDLHLSPQQLTGNKEVSNRILMLCMSVLNTESHVNDNIPSTTVTKHNKEGSRIIYIKTIFGPPWNIVWCFFVVIEDSSVYGLYFYTDVTTFNKICSIILKEDQQQTTDLLVLDSNLKMISVQIVSDTDLAFYIPNLNYINKNTPTKMTITQIQSVHKQYHQLYNGKTNQHAFAAVLFNNHEEFFSVDTPVFQKNKPNIHTEQILLGKIDKYLQQNQQKTGTTAGNILIYTKNSPCLKRARKKETQPVVPCMFQLSEKSSEWYRKYEAYTHVLFAEYWGPIALDLKIEYSKISKSDNLFYPIFRNVTFELDKNYFKDKVKEIDIKQHLSKLEGIERSNFLREFINNKSRIIEFLNYPDSTTVNKLTIHQHFERLQDVIKSSKFHPLIRKEICDSLLKVGRDTIETTALSFIERQIRSSLNSVIVKCFLEDLPSILGNNSPVTFHHVHKDMLKCNIS